MKYCLFTLLLTLPALALGNPDQQEEYEISGSTDLGTEQNDAEETSITWVDDSHAYATDRAQALSEWMDSFFGDPVYDIEKPESLVRLEWANKWDEQEDDKSRVRVRGKLKLPLLSERLNLVFSGDEGDTLPDNRENTGNSAGLLLEVSEAKRSRLDLTLGLDWDGLKPGVRYRNQGPISQRWGYRYTQRFEWESDEGFFTTTRFNLDHALDEDTLLRWGNRVVYGEETEGVEWLTGVSLRRKWENEDSRDPFVLSYFGTVEGQTDPSYIENYRLGMLFRRQFFRRYFFVELEPSYNFRKTDVTEDRERSWNLILRFEVLFETRRRHTRESLDKDSAALEAKTIEEKANPGADSIPPGAGVPTSDVTEF